MRSAGHDTVVATQRNRVVATGDVGLAAVFGRGCQNEGWYREADTW